MTAPNPTWLLDEFRAFERSLALRTAIEMDLFTQIAAGANTIRALAAAVHAPERGLSALCDSLAVQGHLLKRGSRYSLTLNTRLYLTTASPAYLGSAVKFFASDATVAAFCRLRQTVEQGVGPSVLDWMEYARSMAPLAQPVAEFAASALEVDFAGPVQVLDIAAGHGLYGLAIAARNSPSASSSLPMSMRTAPRLEWASALAGFSATARRCIASASSSLPRLLRVLPRLVWASG